MNLTLQTCFKIDLIKYSINNWESKKPLLMNIINSINNFDLDGCQTDYWFVANNGGASYFNQWFSILEEDFSTIEFKINSKYRKEFPIHFGPSHTWKLWTQKYNSGDSHPVHNHGLGFLSAVIYIEFDPSAHQATTFCSPYPNPFYGNLDYYMPEVCEGDIILFPSLLNHFVPTQKSDVTRTIMSFNIPLVQC